MHACIAREHKRAALRVHAWDFHSRVLHCTAMQCGTFRQKCWVESSEGELLRVGVLVRVQVGWSSCHYAGMACACVGRPTALCRVGGGRGVGAAPHVSRSVVQGSNAVPCERIVHRGPRSNHGQTRVKTRARWLGGWSKGNRVVKTCHAKRVGQIRWTSCLRSRLGKKIARMGQHWRWWSMMQTMRRCH